MKKNKIHLNKQGLIKVPANFDLRAYIAESACGGIGIGSGFNCDNPIVAGVDQRLILVDKSVWDRAVITYDVTIISLILTVLLTEIGDAGFVFQGVRRSLNPQSAFVPQTVTVGYDHQVGFQIFEVSQEQKDNIEKLALSKVVGIIQNINAVGNGNSVFEVFGKDVGLEMQASPMRINSDPETNGSYTIDLKTPDEGGKEPKLPTSWFDTDFATTLEAVESLLVPVPEP